MLFDKRGKFSNCILRKNGLYQVKNDNTDAGTAGDSNHPRQGDIFDGAQIDSGETSP